MWKIMSILRGIKKVKKTDKKKLQYLYINRYFVTAQPFQTLLNMKLKKQASLEELLVAFGYFMNHTGSEILIM